MKRTTSYRYLYFPQGYRNMLKDTELFRQLEIKGYQMPLYILWSPVQSNWDNWIHPLRNCDALFSLHMFPVDEAWYTADLLPFICKTTGGVNWIS